MDDAYQKDCGPRPLHTTAEFRGKGFEFAELTDAQRVVGVDPSVVCAIVCALIGNIESTAKEVVPQNLSSVQAILDASLTAFRNDGGQHKAAPKCAQLFFVAENSKFNVAQAEANGWTVIRDTQFHKLDKRSQWITNPFFSAKFYKLQLHRYLPRQIRFVAWLDGTLTVTHPDFMALVINGLRYNATMATFRLRRPNPVIGETLASQWKYGEPSLDTWDLIIQNYLDSVEDGYCEVFWEKPHFVVTEADLQKLMYRRIQYGKSATCPLMYETDPWRNKFVERHFPGRHALKLANTTCRPEGIREKILQAHSSLQHTDYPSVTSGKTTQTFTEMPFYSCFVAWDLYQSMAKVALDEWWTLTWRHWQDQVTLPLVSWELNMAPLILDFVLGGSGDKSLYHHKMGHGA